MSRRDISKREKVREQEEEINERLKDAGFDVEGVSYEDKKGILALLEESKKCAEEEENQRRELQEKEEKMISNTLNESTQMIQMEDVESVGESKEDAEIVSETLNVDQECERQSISSTRSGSLTPDILPQSLVTPTKKKIATSGTPLKSSSSKVPEQSPKGSEDMILFSQTSSKLGVDENTIQNCIETIRVSESEDEDMLCSPVRMVSSPRVASSPSIRSKSVTPSKAQQTNQSLTNKEKLQLFPFSNVKGRPSFRRHQSDDVSTPKSTIQVDESLNASSSSQQLSLNLELKKPTEVKRLENNSLFSPAVEQQKEIENDFPFSPVIGQRKIVPLNSKKMQTPISSPNVQDGEVSNSLSIKPISPSPCDNLSDDNGSENEVITSSQSQPLTKEEVVVASLESNISNGDVLRRRAVKRKVADMDNVTDDKVGCNAESKTTPDEVSSAKNNQGTKTAFQCLQLSDSDEDQVVQSTKRGRKMVNVFSDEKEELPLMRKKGKYENSGKAYFRNNKESSTFAYKRILSLINKAFLDLERYQSTHSCRIPWSAPIRVDKRVKDSLAHPKTVSRKLADVGNVSGSIESNRRVTRNVLQKTSEPPEEDAGSDLSEESIPDVGWYDAKKKNTNKGKGLQLGLSRRQVKQSPKISTVLESDSEDFDIPSSSADKFYSSRNVNKAAPGKYSKSGDNIVSSLNEEKNTTNFDIGDVLTINQENELNQVKKDGPAIINKASETISVSTSSFAYDCQPSTSGVVFPPKRKRKTFRLKADSDDEPVQLREASSTGTQLSDSSDDVQLPSLSLKSPKKFEISKEKSLGEDLCETGNSDRHEEVQSSRVSPEIIEQPVEVLTGSSTIMQRSSALRKGKTVGLLKPPPLRLKNKRGRGRGRLEIVERTDEDLIEEIPSPTIEPSQLEVDQSNSGGNTNEVECPLCSKSFPVNVIEIHASNCGDIVEELPTRSTEIQGRGKRKLQDVESSEETKIAKITSTRNNRERTPPRCARCTFCNTIVPEGDDYLIHVRDCESMLEETCTVTTPNSRPSSIGGRSASRTQSSSSIRSPMPSSLSPSNSIFKRLEETKPVQYHRGSITDSTYKNPTTALLHIMNCVAVRPHGLSETLAKRYPYCNTYTKRKPIDKLNRACVVDRDEPGTFKVCRSIDDKHAPVVVNIFGQFYMGKSYSHNIMSKRVISSMEKADIGNHDIHLVKGIKSDTEENREKWFEQALQKFAEEVSKENIKTVVFPYMIGCGLAGGNWEHSYFPAIQEFVCKVSEKGIQVVIVKLVENPKSDEAVAVEGTKRTSKSQHSPISRNSIKSRSPH